MNYALQNGAHRRGILLFKHLLSSGIIFTSLFQDIRKVFHEIIFGFISTNLNTWISVVVVDGTDIQTKNLSQLLTCLVR